MSFEDPYISYKIGYTYTVLFGNLVFVTPFTILGFYWNESNVRFEFVLDNNPVIWPKAILPSDIISELLNELCSSLD